MEGTDGQVGTINVNEAGTGFTINLNALVADTANPNAGKKITVTYTAKVNETTVKNTAGSHAAGVDYGGENVPVKLFTGELVLMKYGDGDVNKALEKLQKAIEGMEKSEPNPPTDPDSGNTDIVNPDNSLSPDDTPSTNGTPSASDEKAVATGDKETPVGWTTLGFAAMLAAAGRFLGRKKRR